MKACLFVFLGFFSVLVNVDAQTVLTVELQIPEELQPNTAGTFNLEISKPAGMTSYASFKQFVPSSFTVKAKELNGVNFQFQNNELIITWLRLPAGQQVNIGWEVIPSEGISGKFEFGGTFQYLIDNSKGVLELNKTYLEVLKSNTTSDTFDNSINHSVHFKRLRSDVYCERNIVFNDAKTYFVVELNLTGQFLRKYSIVEKIPEGYTFKAYENADADLIVAGTTIQFMTGEIGPSKEYSIKYILVPNATTLKIKPPVYGKFSFVDNNQIVNVSIVDKK